MYYVLMTIHVAFITIREKYLKNKVLLNGNIVRFFSSLKIV